MKGVESAGAAIPHRGRNTFLKTKVTKVKATPNGLVASFEGGKPQ